MAAASKGGTSKWIDVRDEYGVVEDRTSHGLGYCLIAVYPTRNPADWMADERRTRTENPVVVKVRSVAVTDWREVVA